jgi:Arabinose efflux permease
MRKKIAVLGLCFTTLLYLVLAVSVAGLLAAFPDTPSSTVLLTLTLPSLTGILGILVMPCLTRRVSLKTLSMAALVLLCAGGALCLAFHENLGVLLAAGGIMGVAYGIISTLYPMLVNVNFSGAERITVMGLGAAMINAGRLVTYLIGGYLARVRWYRVYDTFLFAAAALVLVALFLPADRVAPEERRTLGDPASLRSKAVWRLSAFSFAFACLYFLISTGASVYVEGSGLGTASLTGWLSALSCAAGGVLAALYGRVSRLTGRFTLAAAFGLTGAGFLFAGLRVSTAGIAAAFFASAVGMALFTPWLMTAISDAARSTDAPTATAVVLTCVNLGYFLSPYVTGPLGRLLGSSAGAPFLADGALSLALCAVTALKCRRRPLV